MNNVIDTKQGVILVGSNLATLRLLRDFLTDHGIWVVPNGIIVSDSEDDCLHELNISKNTEEIGLLIDRFPNTTLIVNAVIMGEQGTGFDSRSLYLAQKSLLNRPKCKVVGLCLSEQVEGIIYRNITSDIFNFPIEWRVARQPYYYHNAIPARIKHNEEFASRIIQIMKSQFDCKCASAKDVLQQSLNDIRHILTSPVSFTDDNYNDDETVSYIEPDLDQQAWDDFAVNATANINANSALEFGKIICDTIDEYCSFVKMAISASNSDDFNVVFSSGIVSGVCKLARMQAITKLEAKG